MIDVRSGISRPARRAPPFLARPGFPDDAPDAGEEGEIPVLDVTQFARLRALMSPRALEQVLSCYLLDAEFQLAEIVRASDTGHRAEAARILADLATEAGAMAVATAARRLEEACHGGDAREARRLALALRHVCGRTERMLRCFLAARP